MDYLDRSDLKHALAELDRTPFSRAQEELEQIMYEKYMRKLSSLKLDDNLALEYSKLQGALMALKELGVTRKNIIANPGVKGEG